jgi:3-oxoadipate enol-lactonase
MNIPSFTVLGHGPTVLMLHGVGGGHLSFAPQVESLANAGFRAVAWDMPGYGRSAPIEPYTFKGLAHSCITLIEALLAGQEHSGGTDRPETAAKPGARRRGGIVLLGHSMGGMVAQEVVARRPDLVSRLILCGTAPAFARRDADAQREFIQERTAPLQAGGTMADVADLLVPRMAGPGSLPEGLRLATHCMSQVPASTYRRALEALVTFDRRADLPRIQVPTLLIAGEHDRDAPAQGMKAMAESIPHGTYLEMPGVGHLQNLEAPDAFDALVLNFLALPRTLLH